MTRGDRSNNDKTTTGLMIKRGAVVCARFISKQKARGDRHNQSAEGQGWMDDVIDTTSYK
jgi:hypothetical protein